MNHLWLVMPVLNEKENLQWILPQLESAGYKVIVVDNGSDDGSGETAEKLGATVLHERQKGYGRAVLKALRHLLQESNEVDPVVCIYDADGSSPVECILSVVEPVLQGDKDLVIAQRTMKNPGSMPFHARFGNWLQVNMIDWLCGYRYLDMGPLRAMRLKHFEELRMKDPTWAWNIEMQVKAAYHKLRIKEVTIEYLPRKYGRSKISGSLIGSIRAGTRIIWGVVFYYFDARKKHE